MTFITHPPQEKKKTRKINMVERVKLFDLMRSRASEWTQNRSNNQDLSAELSKVMGFHISPQTIGEAKRVLNLSWPMKMPQRASSSTSKNQARAERVEMSRQLELLTRAVVEIYEKMGEKLPYYLSDKPADVQNNDLSLTGGK